ncbi:hypothetical protein FRB93_005234 [Tulasnella sp. JGI-2019a]|nr:hypothetical protein FRB93_005234 [Tulasnella sp. JGI-2019a]
MADPTLAQQIDLRHSDTLEESLDNLSLLSPRFDVGKNNAAPGLGIEDDRALQQDDKEGLGRGAHGASEELLTLLPRHLNVSCSNCGLDILGARFQCAICKSVDICRFCDSVGLPDKLPNVNEDHDSSHIMIKIPYPLDARVASRRARVVWSEPDLTIDATTIASEHTRGDRTNPLDHLMECSGCNRQIMGVRYQCANCPSSPTAYNLCHDCEKTSFTIHPLTHVFIKFNRRVDRIIQSQEPLVPTLYQESTNGNPMDASDELVHEATLCDHCMTQIKGVWYRCAYCAADLCHIHEETHDVDHCCLAFKRKVDLFALQSIADISNPSQSTALFHLVYLSSS